MIGRYVLRGLGHLVRRSPSLAFRIGDLIAPGLLRDRRQTEIERIRLLFPDETLAGARRLRAAVVRNLARSLVMLECLRLRGLDGVRPLLRTNPAFDALRPPSILGVFHVGPIYALAVELAGVHGNVFALSSSPTARTRSPNMNGMSTHGDAQRRALAFRRVLHALEAGAFAALALDPIHGLRIDVPFMGRTLALARGPFAIARISGAPIIPMIADWNGDEAAFVIGDPIVAPDDGDRELALAFAAARWLEARIVERPERISARILELTR